MRLRVLGSSSAGNSYILEGKTQSLMLECGVRFSNIQKALGFDYSRLAGCLITHEDGDHCRGVKDVLKAGIQVYCTAGTSKEMGTSGHHRIKEVESGKAYQVGEFKILPFDVQHDAAQPVGFLINHPECGNTLFLTDSYYSGYTFNGLNNILVEANYCQDVIDQRLLDGKIEPFLRNRIMKSHMSLQTCKDLLRANDMSAVHHIVLIHLSDGNSDSRRFKKEVQEITGRSVHIADAGLVIENFNKTPF